VNFFFRSDYRIRQAGVTFRFGSVPSIVLYLSIFTIDGLCTCLTFGYHFVLISLDLLQPIVLSYICLFETLDYDFWNILTILFLSILENA
jgi:hypothetical protein